MAEILQDKKRLMVNIVIALCYAIFTFFIVLKHEIWADEAQVWLLVKNLSLTELFNHFGEEGHPPLFYLLVFPFAKLNLSIFSMQILCWLFSISAVFLLFHYSPFKWWLNSAVMISGGFLYVFPVISRSYSLLPFLVFFAAILYQKRKEQPLLYALSLFLISMTHVIMFGFVSILLLLFVVEILKEKRFDLKTLVSVFFVAFGILYVLLLSFVSIGNNDYISPVSQILIIPYLLRFFASAFIYDISTVRIFAIILYCLLFFVLLFNLLKFSLKAFFVAISAVFVQFSIYIICYPVLIYLTRVYSMYLILLFVYWIAWEKCSNKKWKMVTTVLLMLFLIMTSFNGIQLIKNDYFGAYSGSKETAEFIMKNINPETDIILTDIVQNNLGTVAYLKNGCQIYYAPSKMPIKYALWRADKNNYFQYLDWNRYLPNFRTNKNIYLLLPDNIDFNKINNTKVIFVSKDSTAEHEKFYLLKYEGNR